MASASEACGEPLFALPATAPRRVDGPIGLWEWLLEFHWCDAASTNDTRVAPAGEVARLHIEGLRPADLRWIEVRQWGQVLYQLDSCEGRTGHVVSAGDMLHAMASLFGVPGLTIDGVHLGLGIAARALVTHLQVRVSSPDLLHRVQVRLCLHPGGAG